jgi:RimJ/RimL family protein N-acetyltransferase
MNQLSAVVLAGDFVTLHPLEAKHISALRLAVLDGELWKIWYAKVPSPDEMESYVAHAISESQRGNLAFAVTNNATGKVVGTTRFYNVEPQHRRGMLGYTWYSRSVQGTKINAECKYLLLQHFFERHSANAVEFRTHFFNQPSRRAIEKLGAKQDGVLRSHEVMKDGSIRDTVVYSILSNEWAAVRNGLCSRLSA